MDFSNLYSLPLKLPVVLQTQCEPILNHY